MVEEDIKIIPESYYGFIMHYYRAEVYRETSWRNRLDVTTNWSIVVSAAVLSFAFSTESIPHSVLLMNFIIVWFFLYIESRRFRYYSLLRERTRLIEKHLFNQVFSGSKHAQIDSNWAKKLVESFNNPRIAMSRLESLAWRLRRNYIVIFPLLFISWLAKVKTLTIEGKMTPFLFENARLWFISGEIVFFVFLFSVLITIALAFYIPQTSHDDDLP